MTEIVLVDNIGRIGRNVLSGALRTPHRILEYPCDLAATHVLVGSRISPSLVEQTPRLRLVHTTGAGHESVAFDALPPGVPVCNVFHHEQAMAEHIMMMILVLDRDLFGQDRRLRAGDWQGSCVTSPPLAQELHARQVGIIGYGHIGQATGRLAEVFGMHVYGLRSTHTRADLEGLLSSSDYVVLACPLNGRTRGLIGETELRLMKPTAALINVARGDVVTESALYKALRERRIRGAAIDVWYQYPRNGEPRVLPGTLPFHELDNVILTPHSSGWTSRVLELRFRDIAANIDRLVAGEPLVNVVHPG